MRALAAVAPLAASAIVAVLALPEDRLGAPVDPSLLRDFRLASFASQGLFWLACAAGGSYFLRWQDGKRAL